MAKRKVYFSVWIGRSKLPGVDSDLGWIRIWIRIDRTGGLNDNKKRNEEREGGGGQ